MHTCLHMPLTLHIWRLCHMFRNSIAAAIEPYFLGKFLEWIIKRSLIVLKKMKTLWMWKQTGSQTQTNLLRPVQRWGPPAAPKCAQWRKAWACPGQRAGRRVLTGLSAGWGAPHSGGRTPIQDKTDKPIKRSTRIATLEIPRYTE